MQTHPTKVTGIFCAGRWIILLCCLLAATPVLAAEEFSLDFTTIRLGDDAQGAIVQTAQTDTGTLPAEANPARLPVVLVVGGIQGDEPGGFSAATLLTTHYTIQKGVLWVVPNLNFPSIRAGCTAT